jgi:hypothetical protein
MIELLCSQTENRSRKYDEENNNKSSQEETMFFFETMRRQRLERTGKLTSFSSTLRNSLSLFAELTGFLLVLGQPHLTIA